MGFGDHSSSATVSGVISVDPVTLYTVLVDEASDTITYVGEAAVGSATSATSWQIKRINSATLSAEILYADGDTEHDNIWDNRAGLSYS